MEIIFYAGEPNSFRSSRIPGVNNRTTAAVSLNRSSKNVEQR
jgi:hypothetical protein